MMALSQDCFSQAQQGYVKTQGRPNKPGVPLSGVSIRMRGMFNQVLSQQNGRFSILMPNKKNGDVIILQSVRKNGYELKDYDMIGRSLTFSTSVPIEIVMINTEELNRNRQRIEKKAYEVAEKNFQTKLHELKKQVEEQRITAEQYNQQYNDLQNKYEKYQALIGEMADRYARTDYDHLDSIDYVINMCIENGELEKADSLIHTVFDPNTVLKRNRAAKAEVRAKMELAQQIIDKANADMEALRRDKDYAVRVALLGENLAEEYLAKGERERALDCLRKSLVIKQMLFGEHSAEVDVVQKKLETFKLK